ncbi:hypothetical protein [Geobacter sp. SVR]|uniref:hypothetical protein n=1 Tax=Geobacter sp. SVR TaxID=2495594 RepID=UPI00143EFE51|nr:hypothetical protein [Geobacter sp. SVR]BCS54181.1 hypothetical protein GSVR_24890 [Geobacter sp. SVR]GCF85960.1 hypothetical protein GSbR_25600 [Geobacter sp. SVR]
MATCEYSSTCFFFNETMDEMPRTADFFRETFCMGKSARCARFKLSKSAGIEKVPDYLAPFSLRGPKCFCGLH